MPRARVEIAERLILHLIEIRIELDGVTVVVTMKDGNVVPRSEAQWTPDNRKLGSRQHVACVNDVASIAQFKRNVVHARAFAFDKIHRMMIRIAAQENEKVVDPVGDAKTEQSLVEFGNLRGVGTEEGDMAKLERADASGVGLRFQKAPLGKQLDRRPLGIWERQRFCNTGTRPLTFVAGDPLFGQLLSDLGEIRIGSDFER